MSFDTVAEFLANTNDLYGTEQYHGSFYNSPISTQNQAFASFWWFNQGNTTVRRIIDAANVRTRDIYYQFLLSDARLITDVTGPVVISAYKQYQELRARMRDEDLFTIWEFDTAHGNQGIDRPTTLHAVMDHTDLDFSAIEQRFRIREGTARSNHDATDAELDATLRDGAGVRMAVSTSNIWSGAFSWASVLTREGADFRRRWARVVTSSAGLTLDITTGRPIRRRDVALETPYDPIIVGASRFLFDDREYITESIAEVDRLRTLRFGGYHIDHGV